MPAPPRIGFAYRQKLIEVSILSSVSTLIAIVFFTVGVVLFFWYMAIKFI